MEAVVETSSGKLEGLREGGLITFRGVPFGVAPARWSPARAPEPWAGVRSAQAFGPWAPQNGGDALFRVRAPLMDEDCLQLNVWTPGTDANRRPVLVWIHGGAFTNGSGNSPVYDGSRLARDGDVVVVTVSYRLGIFGFLRLVDVTNGRIPSTGNEGLIDQRLALAWVSENIERFGGDPHNVTIFGESAGAMSVGFHLAMKSSAPLFHKAIAQSGACHGGADVERANGFAETTLQILETRPEDAAELRSAPVSRLLKAQQRLQLQRTRVRRRTGMAYAPVIDGEIVEGHPLRSVEGGSATGKPLIVGTTGEEWKLFAYVRPDELGMTSERLRRRLALHVTPERVDETLDVYRRSLASRGVPDRPFEIWCGLQTDRVFRIPAIRLAEAQQPHSERVFMYRFDWPSRLGRMGACHALDLAFVFGTHDLPGARRFCGESEGVDRLSREMRRAWTHFAHTGSPGGDWPPYASRRATRVLAQGPHTEHDPGREERLLWQREDRALGLA